MSCAQLQLSCAQLKSLLLGVTDHLAQDEAHALSIARDIVANLNLPPSASSSSAAPAWQEPLYPPHELRGVVPADTRQTWDVRVVLARLLDGSRFEEFKSNYGKTLVTGKHRAGVCSRQLGGRTVSQCDASRLYIKEDGITACVKPAHFVEVQVVQLLYAFICFTPLVLSYIPKNYHFEFSAGWQGEQSTSKGLLTVL